MTTKENVSKDQNLSSNTIARQSCKGKYKVQIKNQSSTQTWKTENQNIPRGDWKQTGAGAGT